ncbi:hypothetical protein U1Q18_007156 [Sarracenia purpurea var. burkii]
MAGLMWVRVKRKKLRINNGGPGQNLPSSSHLELGEASVTEADVHKETSDKTSPQEELPILEVNVPVEEKVQVDEPNPEVQATPLEEEDPDTEEDSIDILAEWVVILAISVVAGRPWMKPFDGCFLRGFKPSVFVLRSYGASLYFSIVEVIFGCDPVDCYGASLVIYSVKFSEVVPFLPILVEPLVVVFAPSRCSGWAHLKY